VSVPSVNDPSGIRNWLQRLRVCARVHQDREAIGGGLGAREPQLELTGIDAVEETRSSTDDHRDHRQPILVDAVVRDEHAIEIGEAVFEDIFAGRALSLAMASAASPSSRAAFQVTSRTVLDAAPWPFGSADGVAMLASR